MGQLLGDALCFLLLLILLVVSVQQIRASATIEVDFNVQSASAGSSFFASLLSQIANAFQGLGYNDPVGVEENRTLEQIYQAALKEGNGTSLVVYQGGTARGQGAGTEQAFARRFPGLSVDIVVDYSTYHGPRLDVQLANGSLVPDVVQLQTLQDYGRWKEQGKVFRVKPGIQPECSGHLMQYKPANWSKVYSEFRDPDGFYTANIVALISTVVNGQQLPDEAQWPRTAEDLLKPEFKGSKIVTLHPNMDDFVLFYYKQVVDKYGFDWLAQFAAQQPVFVCDGFAQLVAVGLGGNGTATVSPAAFYFPFGNGTNVPQMAFPVEDDEPIATYAMYAAIFKQTKLPETAKLYINWLLEKESPNNQGAIWSVRTDMEPAQGFRQVWQYPNSNHSAFVAFMEDYELKERFNRQIDLFLGPTSCNNTGPLESGLAPWQT